MADNDGNQTSNNDTANSSGNSNSPAQTEQGGTNNADQSNDQGNSVDQARIDAIVKDRLARERAKFQGFEDYKKKAEEYDKLQEANKSEFDKLQDALNKERDKATGAETRMRNALTRAAIVDAASRNGAADPGLLVKLIDSSELEITEDGEVKGAEEAVTAMLASHPYLKGNGFTGNSDGGQRTSGGVATFTRTQIADPLFFREHKQEILAAQKAGRILDE